MNRRHLLLGLPGLLTLPTQAPADDMVPIKPFMMMDVNGAVVTDESLRGKYSLVFFGYTHCPDLCPTSLNTLAEILKKLGEDSESVLALFVTVDPDRDTAKLLSEYIQNFDDRIVALHGPKAYTDAMAAAFGVKYQIQQTRDAGVYTIDHTASLALVGPDGILIKRYPHDQAAVDVAEDLRTIMAQAPVSP